MVKQTYMPGAEIVEQKWAPPRCSEMIDPPVRDGLGDHATEEGGGHHQFTGIHRRRSGPLRISAPAQAAAPGPACACRRSRPSEQCRRSRPSEQRSQAQKGAFVHNGDVHFRKQPCLRCETLGGFEAGAVKACGRFDLQRIFDETDVSCSSELAVKCAVASAYDVNPSCLRVAGFRSAGVGNGRSSYRALPGNVDWIKANPQWVVYRAFRLWFHLGPLARAAARGLTTHSRTRRRHFSRRCQMKIRQQPL
jgi:hypothetical protein